MLAAETVKNLFYPSDKKRQWRPTFYMFINLQRLRDMCSFLWMNHPLSVFAGVARSREWYVNLRISYISICNTFSHLYMCIPNSFPETHVYQQLVPAISMQTCTRILHSEIIHVYQHWAVVFRCNCVPNQKVSGLHGASRWNTHTEKEKFI